MACKSYKAQAYDEAGRHAVKLQKILVFLFVSSLIIETISWVFAFTNHPNANFVAEIAPQFLISIAMFVVLSLVKLIGYRAAANRNTCGLTFYGVCELTRLLIGLICIIFVSLAIMGGDVRNINEKHDQHNNRAGIPSDAHTYKVEAPVRNGIPSHTHIYKADAADADAEHHVDFAKLAEQAKEKMSDPKFVAKLEEAAKNPDLKKQLEKELKKEMKKVAEDPDLKKHLKQEAEAALAAAAAKLAAAHKKHQEEKAGDAEHKKHDAKDADEHKKHHDCSYSSKFKHFFAHLFAQHHKHADAPADAASSDDVSQVKPIDQIAVIVGSSYLLLVSLLQVVSLFLWIISIALAFKVRRLIREAAANNNETELSAYAAVPQVDDNSAASPPPMYVFASTQTGPVPSAPPAVGQYPAIVPVSFTLPTPPQAKE